MWFSRLLLLCGKCSFLLIFFLGIIGCKKEDTNFNITIEGYFINSINGDSIPNTIIEIWEDDHGGSNLLSDFNRKIGTTVSDATGQYSITFSGSELKTYGIIGYKQNFNNDGWVEIIRKSKLKMNIYKIPLTWMRIHIRNEPPISASDSIHFYNNIFLSGNTDTVIIQEFDANSQKLNNWDITINNITTTYSNYNSCNSFDTCLLNIYY